MLLRALVLLAVLACCRATQPALFFVDSPGGNFLNAKVSLEGMTSAALSAAAASLLAVQPSLAISSSASQQVEALIRPDVFARPAALLAVQIAGVDPGSIDAQSAPALFGERPWHQVAFSASQPQTTLLLSLRSVSDSTASRLEYQALDFTGLKGCSDACVEELLKGALEGLRGSYSPGHGPMTGVVTLQPSAAGTPVQLDLANLAERLWAAELATLHQTVADFVAEKARRAAQDGDGEAPAPVLLEATLVGMQALRDAYGTESAQYAAAWQALAAELRAVQDALSQAFDDKLVSQVSLLGKVPVGKDSIRGLLQWREAHRARHLLAPMSVYAANNGTSTPEQWANKAIAWTSFLILLFFTFAGIYCLTNMQFQRDSLLYGRTKAD